MTEIDEMAQEFYRRCVARLREDYPTASLDKYGQLITQEGSGIESWLKVEAVAALSDWNNLDEVRVQDKGPDLSIRLTNGQLFHIELKAATDFGNDVVRSALSKPEKGIPLYAIILRRDEKPCYSKLVLDEKVGSQGWKLGFAKAEGKSTQEGQ